MKIEFGKYYTYKYLKNNIAYFVVVSDIFCWFDQNLVYKVLMIDYNADEKRYLYNRPAKHKITLALINALKECNNLKEVTDKKTITKLQLLGLFPIYA